MVAHARCEAIVTSLQTPKMKRGVVRIFAPQKIIFSGEILNIGRQSLQQLPESSGGD